MLGNFLPFLLFGIANWVMLIMFIVFWVKNAREARPYLQSGLILVALHFALESAMLHSAGADVFPQSTTLTLFLLGISALRICAFAVVGLLIAERLNRAFDAAEPSGTVGHQLARYGLFNPSRHGLIFALIATLFMMVYSSVLFRLTDVSPSAAIQQLQSHVEPSLALVLAVISAGFAEEIVYRLGLQNALTYWWRHSDYGHHWAVLATSALWSVGHMGVLEPGWVKIAQVFAFGLILGYMNRRFGIGSCIIMHCLFNAVMAVFSTQLLGV